MLSCVPRSKTAKASWGNGVTFLIALACVDNIMILICFDVVGVYSGYLRFEQDRE